MGGLRRSTVLVGCVTVILALWGAAPANAASPCAVPDALRAAGLFPEADAAYRTLAATVPQDPCVPDGLRALRAERERRARVLAAALRDTGVSENTAASLAAAIRSGAEGSIPTTFRSEVTGGDGFAIARALKLAGYPGAAGEAVAARLAAKPDAELPDDLQRLSDAGLHVATAEALARVGLDKESRDELTAALKLDPTLEVPDDLAEPNRQVSWWRDALGHYGPALRTATEIVIVALATVVLLLLSVRALKRFRARITISEFVDTPASKVGADVANAVREQYRRLRTENGGTNLTHVTAAGEAFGGPPKPIVDAYPQAGIVFGLIGIVDRLLPSRNREVSGAIRPRDPIRGVGLSLTLARRYGKVFDEITLWESTFGPPAPADAKDGSATAYDRLAVPAAVWLLYAAGNHGFGRRWSTIILKRSFRILGTAEWMSYAQFAVGAERQGRGDVPGALGGYRAALARDQANRGATFDLAIIELQAKTPEGFASGFARLVELRKTISKGGHAAREPMWYRVKYAQTVAWMEPKLGNRRCARLSAVVLASTILDTLHRTRGFHQPKRWRKTLRTLLESVQPATLVSLASTLVLDQRPNLPTTVDKKTLRKALRAFADDRKQPGSTAAFDAKVTHRGIVEYVVNTFSPLDGQTRYNLACYYTRVEALPEAREHLLHALELVSTGVQRWALVDSALEAYRADPKLRAELEALVSRLADPPPAAPKNEDPEPKQIELRVGRLDVGALEPEPLL